MKASEIRAQFLNFFQSKGHTIVPSSSVVPGDDPTLLFTNAGMNQFKNVFLGLEKRHYRRATTAQKCIRAGGKHNDLENVGYTARHHTFFEMLGNFSFGDYFKRDAISYAWELLTTVYKLPAEKLWVTVYAQDDEAFDIWHHTIGVPTERIVRIGDNKGAKYASDNFWMMGDTGPCGPCTEIFYDHGPSVAGGPPGSDNEDGDRYIEIWNNVFMQFNRDEAGVMHPLPQPSVDTGMGLERLAAVLQHVHSNYDIDSFTSLLAFAQSAVAQAGGQAVSPESPSLKVIADHIRACSFMVADGVVPGPAGRGYVLRRITRRAIRHGYKLGARTPFFFRLVSALVRDMGAAYPELQTHEARITAVLEQEETHFFRTIANGMDILETALAPSPQMLDGALAFKLHDTFGFPFDLTADVCRERGVAVDRPGFDAAMAKQKADSQAADQFKMAAHLTYSGVDSMFHGYDTLTHEGAVVSGLYVQGSAVTSAQAGDDVVVVLDHTPFYAESGGQVGDGGELRNAYTHVRIEHTSKITAQAFGHYGTLLEGRLQVGDVLTAKVDATRRLHTARNHSATHLLHKALCTVLGPHVQQKGSQVSAERTRFDFAHTAALSHEQIQRIDTLVNQEIWANTATLTRVLTIEAAQQTGATMLFGEKYGDHVRVLDIGSSRELCGGTHVGHTGDIGLFKIVAQSGVAAGVRRIEALTGESAWAHVQQLDQQLNELAAMLKVPSTQALSRVDHVLEQLRQLDKELANLKSQQASSHSDHLLAQALDVKGVKVLAAVLEGSDIKALRDTLDKLKDKLKSAVIILALVQDNKVQLAAGVTPDQTSRIKAGELVNFVATQVGGKGGGKADMAMAGGIWPEHLPKALQSVAEWVSQRI